MTSEEADKIIYGKLTPQWIIHAINRGRLTFIEKEIDAMIKNSEVPKSLRRVLLSPILSKTVEMFPDFMFKDGEE
jgi:hypothetical protein